MYLGKGIVSQVNHLFYVNIRVYILLMLAPISIFNSSGRYEFSKVPFAHGTTMIDGSVDKTCEKVNMTAVCNGGFDSTCPGNSHSCMTTDLSIDCGNSVMDELSKHICKENDPRN